MQVLQCLLEIDSSDAHRLPLRRVRAFGGALGRLADEGPSKYCSVLSQAFSRIPFDARYGGILVDLSNVLLLSAPEHVLLGLAAEASGSPGWRSEAQQLLCAAVPRIKDKAGLLEPGVLRKLLLLFRAWGLQEEFRETRETCSGLDLADDRYAALRPLMVEEGGLPGLGLLGARGAGDEGMLAGGGGGGGRGGTGAQEDPLRATLGASTASLAAAMQENGYSCAKSEETFRAVLDVFDALDEAEVARMLGVVARTHTGLPDASGLVPGLANLLKEPLLAEGEAPPQEWNVSVIMSVLLEKFPRLDWKLVARRMDHSDFYLPDQQAFQVLMGMYVQGAGAPFPVAAVCRDGALWDNTAGQMSLLEHAMAAALPGFSFAGGAGMDVHALFHHHRRNCKFPGQLRVPGLSPFHNEVWSCVDLTKTLVGLGDAGHAEAVRKLLAFPIKECPDLLMVGISCFGPPWSRMQEEVLEVLMPAYLLGHKADPLNAPILQCMHSLSTGLLPRYLVNRYAAQDANLLSQAILIFHEWGYFEGMLLAIPAPVAIELACLASQNRENVLKNVLGFEGWVGAQLKGREGADRADFVEACLLFLGDFVRPGRAAGPPEKAENVLRMLESLFKALKSNKKDEALPKEAQARVKELQAAVGGRVADLTVGWSVPPGVEEEANGHLQKLYSEKISVEELIATLEGMQGGGARAQETFAAIVHSLFDEYRFFPNYPDRELLIAAGLMGQLVQSSLLGNGACLDLAFHAFANALSHPPDSKMHAFGRTGLDQFKPRLGEWPKFCQGMLQVPHLRSSAPDVVQLLEQGLGASSKGAPDGAAPGQAKGRPDSQHEQQPKAAPAAAGGGGGAAPGPSSFATLNSDALEAANTASFVMPDEALADKIHFAVNNLSRDNLSQKVEEVKSKLTPEFFPWFSHYLVVKRASQEANFHHLYLSLLDGLQAPPLYRSIVATTIRNTNLLLVSDRVRTSSSDRSLLKNLGLWLGQLTLTRNRPILSKDLDLKQTVLDAYEQGKMIAAIPFVHNVLKSVNDGIVFRPTNPWTAAILKLLVEIYNLDRLKLNLKFEIEMCFKNLQLKIADMAPSVLLPNLERVQEANPDFAQEKGKPVVPPPGRAGPVDKRGVGATAPGGPRVADVGEGSFGYAQGSGGINLASYVTINPSLEHVAERLQLRRLVLTAIDQSIREIIAPVVERSITIACKTTLDLTLKDFVFEPDEARVRLAAHLMVKSLSGSLALVTCKEPLRLQLMNHLRQPLQQHMPDSNILEQMVQVITTDNLELCCSLIEKTATDKAQRSIDELLLTSYAARRKHREANPNQPFVDVSVLTPGRFPQALPEALRPKPGHLNPSQFRVYEDFTQMIRSPAASGAPTLDAASVVVPPAPGAGAGSSAGEGLLPAQESAIRELVHRLEAGCAKEPVAPLASLPSSHDVHKACEELQAVVMSISGARANEARAAVSELLCRHLYQPGRPKLLTEALVLLLHRIRDSFPTAVAGLPEWVLSMEEDRWLNGPVAEALVRARLLPLSRLDGPLANLIVVSASQRGSAHGNAPMELAIHLTRQFLVIEQLAGIQDFGQTLEVLSTIASQGRGGSAGDALASLLEQAKSGKGGGGSQGGSPVAHPSAAAFLGSPGDASMLGVMDADSVLPAVPVWPDPARDPQGMREKVAQMLDEWARVCDPISEKGPLEVFAKLQQSRLLKTEEMADRFFRILVELAVGHCLASEPSASGTSAALASPPPLSFAAVDAFVKLSAFMVRKSAPTQAGGKTEGGAQQAPKLARVLAVVAGALMRDAGEQGSAFNPRPYFRMYIGWYMEIIEVAAASGSSEEEIFPIAAVVVDSLHQLRPGRVPAFAFAWLELMSHRAILPRILQTPHSRGWALYQRLLVSLLEFMEPYLRHAELTEPIRLLYKGTLRVLLVLLHDFPEFLCAHHFQLCNVIPASSIQMRNLVLSAFPRTLSLPDPFTPNLKVDLLPEISETPRLAIDLGKLLPGALAAQVDEFIELGGGGAHPTRQARRASLRRVDNLRKSAAELADRLRLPAGEALAAESVYSVPLVNALVLYLGASVIQQMQTSAQLGAGASPRAACMELFQHLAEALCPEGRFLFFNAMANQLRYPNNHTHYFSCVLLFVFAEAGEDTVKEQVTRVLLERLIVNRPHPWGLLVTFIELIKNPRYNFWAHPFTRCAPEIERLFESVSQSCIGAVQLPKPAPEEVAT